MVQSPEYPDLQWIPPKSFTKGRWAGQPTKITVHYTAGHEGYLDAENGARYDQVRTDGTSSHYYVDADSVVHCVRTTDRSHTALYHGNNEGIHYELCGTAQTRAQWLDPVSRATIRNAARQMARDMRKYGIPLVRLVGREVRDSARKGICGHADWTVGWPEDGGTHMDPGTYFPWDVLFADIQAALDGTMEEDDMFPTAIKTPSADQVKASPPVAARTYSESEFDDLIGYDLARGDVTMRTVLALSGQVVTLTAQMGALIAAANDTVQRDAEERERELAADAAEQERQLQLLAKAGEIQAALAVVPGVDPAVWADRVAELLIPHLPAADAGAFVDALRDRLAE